MNLQGGKGLLNAHSGLFVPAERVTTSKRWLRIRVYSGLLILDCMIICGAFLAGNAFRHDKLFAAAGLNIVAMLLPIYLMAALNKGIYSSTIFNSWRQSAVATVSAFGIATVAVLIISFYLQATQTLSREVFTLGVGWSAVLLFVSRRYVSRFALRLVDGEPLSRVFIQDGTDVPISSGILVYDAAAIGIKPDIRDPHMLDKVAQLLHHADRVIVGCPPERRSAWAMLLKGANIGGEIMIPELDELSALGAGSLAGCSTLIISDGPLDMRNRAIKRAMDMTFAIGVLFALAPLMLFTALLIKLESEGPVFFVQPRLGRGNRLFKVYKFRSMRAEACDADGKQSTKRDDDRVTRVGRIIRATSIDELPQIINVFRGEMSIVGPRPHALGSLAGDKLFWEVDERYWHRHAAKPGITGLAQVRGFRGATHLQSDLVDRLQADLDYLNGWTVWRDISILVATFKVLIHRNAY